MDELRPVEESLASVPSPKQSDVDDHSCTSKNVASVGTQWEDHIFEEHCYIKRQHIRHGRGLVWLRAANNQSLIIIDTSLPQPSNYY
uniref:Uncharacterized protein n=1 Tax=Sinocyclocheilus anshuiensis TaxID=1608454 RepID=A0A671QDP6_9TELE